MIDGAFIYMQENTPWNGSNTIFVKGPIQMYDSVDYLEQAFVSEKGYWIGLEMDISKCGQIKQK